MTALLPAPADYLELLQFDITSKSRSLIHRWFTCPDDIRVLRLDMRDDNVFGDPFQERTRIYSKGVFNWPMLAIATRQALRVQLMNEKCELCISLCTAPGGHSGTAAWEMTCGREIPGPDVAWLAVEQHPPLDLMSKADRENLMSTAQALAWAWLDYLAAG